MNTASDEGRDTVAETLVNLFGLISPTGWLVLFGLVALFAAIGVVRSVFPKKVHRWCGGKGHWGIGPFRRSCGACSGSGLVDR